MTSPLRNAVDAYDAARCKLHSVSIEVGGMSETNKNSIQPMFRAAICAALETEEVTSAIINAIGDSEGEPVGLRAATVLAAIRDQL